MCKIIQLAMLLLTVCCSPAFADHDRFPHSVEGVNTLENNNGNADDERGNVGSGDFNFFFDFTHGIPAWMYDNTTVSEPVQKGGYKVSTRKKTKKPSDTITYQSNK